MVDANPDDPGGDSSAAIAPDNASSIVGIRRVFAALLDGLIIGSAGFALSWSMADQLSAIGPSTRWIGLPILICYFGLTNSRLFGGQTLGKRLLDIKVVGYDGLPIQVRKSFVRSILLEAPIIMNGAVYTFGVGEFVYSILAAYAVFLVVIANIYLFLLNRTTRQGLHDIVAGTLVVRATDPLAKLPSSLQRESAIRWNLIVVGVHAIALTVGLFWLWGWAADADRRGLYDDLVALQTDLISLESVSYASVVVNTEHPAQVDGSYLSVTLYLVRPSDSVQPLAKELICELGNDHPWIRDKSRVVVRAIYGYDIGIWSFWRASTEQFRPQEFACDEGGGMTQT